MAKLTGNALAVDLAWWASRRRGYLGHRRGGGRYGRRGHLGQRRGGGRHGRRGHIGDRSGRRWREFRWRFGARRRLGGRRFRSFGWQRSHRVVAPTRGRVLCPRLPNPHHLVEGHGSSHVGWLMAAHRTNRSGHDVRVHAGQAQGPLPRTLGDPHGLHPSVRGEREPTGQPAMSGGEHLVRGAHAQLSPLQR